MLNPKVCWVANTRTIWAYLVVKHADNIDKANQELRLYWDDDTTSEMTYRIWVELHTLLAVSMMRLAEEGEKIARKAGVKSGKIKYLWADAIANALYEKHHA